MADGKRTLSGHAAKYSNLSHDLGGFREMIAPGAFDSSLAAPDADICAFYGHDMGQGILGRTTSGTLRLKSDDIGLAFELDLPSTNLGNDVYEMVSRQDLTGCSFGFTVDDDSWAVTKDGGTVRTLNSVSLFEISCVPFPAYPDTSVTLRSMFPDGFPEVIDPTRDDYTLTARAKLRLALTF